MRHLYCLKGIVHREILRFIHQYGRLAASLARPLLWLLIFAPGFRSQVTLDVPYDYYILPGLIALMQLFNAMQSSLSMVYDREMGSMRILLTTPLPRWYLLTCKMIASVAVSFIQTYLFLVIAYIYGIRYPFWGYLTLIPALTLSGMMLGAFGLLLSSGIRQLESYAGVINFVIFPLFFMSSALYPLSQIRLSNELLATIASYNPMTFAIEAIRAGLIGQYPLESLFWVAATMTFCMLISFYAYNPARGFSKS